MVYYTGDTLNHRVWATSTENNINVIKKINGILRETYKNVGVPVFPALGNHEPSPLDV